MSDDAEKYSVYKTLAILLAICLVGVTWLHLWYTDRLNQELSQRDDQISTNSERLAQADQRIGLLGETETGLRSDIDGLQGQVVAAKETSDGLRAEIESLKSTNAAAVDDLQQAYADTLAAEQQEAADAYAALTTRIDTANQQVSVLDGEIETMQAAAVDAEEQHRQAIADVNRQMADAAAANEQALAARDEGHQARTQQLEADLTERLVFYQTALEGEEPERAAQLMAIEEETASLRSAIDEGAQQIATLEASLAETSEKLTVTDQALAGSEQRLASTQQELTGVQGQLSESQDALNSLQAEYDAAKQQATQALADSQETLRLANEEHAAREAAAEELLAQTKSDAAAAFAQAQTEAVDLLAKTQTDAAAELAQIQADSEAVLAQTSADAEVALQEAKAAAATAMTEAAAKHGGEMDAANQRIAGLEGSLSSEKAMLAEVKGEYSAFTFAKATELESVEQNLRDVSNELDTTKAAAAATEASLEKRIAAAEAENGELEQQIVMDRQQAAEQLLASVRRGQQDVARMRGMYQGFDRLGARKTDKGMLLNLGGNELNFRVGQAVLRSDELPSLDGLAEFLNGHPALSARIEGHTDSSGRDETNLKLSRERAETVMSALGERGVELGRLSAVGVGEERPITDNETKYGRFENRRVEIYINGH